MTEEMKKAARVEDGQPADLTAQRKATEAYHADDDLSNGRDRAMEWLQNMATLCKIHEFEEDIWACGVGRDGIHMKGAAKIGEMAGFPVTVDSETYSEISIRLEYFTFDGVRFYELFREDEEEEEE